MERQRDIEREREKQTEIYRETERKREREREKGWKRDRGNLEIDLLLFNNKNLRIRNFAFLGKPQMIG